MDGGEWHDDEDEPAGGALVEHERSCDEEK